MHDGNSRETTDKNNIKNTALVDSVVTKALLHGAAPRMSSSSMFPPSKRLSLPAQNADRSGIQCAEDVVRRPSNRIPGSLKCLNEHTSLNSHVRGIVDVETLKWLTWTEHFTFDNSRTTVVVSSTTVLRCFAIRCHLVLPKSIEAFAAVAVAAVGRCSTTCRVFSLRCLLSLPLSLPISPLRLDAESLRLRLHPGLFSRSPDSTPSSGAAYAESINISDPP